MKAHRKCPRCEADLVLVEDENRTSVGQVEDRHTVKVWKCVVCGYSQRKAEDGSEG